MLLNSQPVLVYLCPRKSSQIDMKQLSRSSNRHRYAKDPSINLKFPLTIELTPNVPELQSFVVEKIRGLMDHAKSPIILIDGRKKSG